MGTFLVSLLDGFRRITLNPSPRLRELREQMDDRNMRLQLRVPAEMPGGDVTVAIVECPRCYAFIRRDRVNDHKAASHAGV